MSELLAFIQARLEDDSFIGANKQQFGDDQIICVVDYMVEEMETDPVTNEQYSIKAGKQRMFILS